MQLLAPERMEACELTQQALLLCVCMQELCGVADRRQLTGYNQPFCHLHHPPTHPPGRMLGYREANIRHHIQSTGGQLSGEVATAVDAELAGLSAAPPSLPWTGRGSRRGKA